MPELVENTTLSLRTVERIIEKLKTDEVLFRIGSKKNGTWKILKDLAG